MLRQHGVHVECCADPEICRSLSKGFTYDAIIYLHESEPEPARDFYTAWKTQGGTSCFALLTRNQSGLERGRALALGMDIYQIEPFSYCDLLIELSTQKLRKGLRPRGTLSSGLFQVDILSRTICYRGELLRLSKTEFGLLHCLIRRRGNVLSRAQLWDEVWPGRDYPLGNAVDVHLARIRKKLLPLELIQSVHGIGYRMRADA